MSRIEEEFKIFSWEFVSPTQIDIEETSQGVAIIKGTLISEGVSKNGNVYSIDEMEKLAKTAEDAPIYFGTMDKYDPDVGLMKKNAHANVKTNLVGKIMSAIYDAISRKVRFIAQIMNTDKFPNLIEEVKSGWGISIGGKAKGQLMLDQFGRMLTKIKDMIVNHVQLLRPEVARGQEAAQVEGEPEPTEIQESFTFYEVPQPNVKEINIKMGHGGSVNINL